MMRHVFLTDSGLFNRRIFEAQRLIGAGFDKG